MCTFMHENEKVLQVECDADWKAQLRSLSSGASEAMAVAVASREGPNCCPQGLAAWESVRERWKAHHELGEGKELVGEEGAEEVGVGRAVR